MDADVMQELERLEARIDHVATDLEDEIRRIAAQLRSISNDLYELDVKASKHR